MITKRLATNLFLIYIFLTSFLFSFGQGHPINLGPEVNSDYDELNPVISADGKFLYFVRRNHPENTFGKDDSEDIWFCTTTTPYKWEQAKRLKGLNAARYNSVLDVSEDGRRLLLSGIFSSKNKKFLKRGLSVSIKRREIWGPPIPLKVKGLSSDNKGMTTTGVWNSKEDVIILSYSRQYLGKNNDLFLIRKLKNGKWEAPQKIEALNSAQSEEAPFLTPDGKKIYFSSDRTTPGQFDIYEADLTGRDWLTWSTPTLVKFPINSSGWESHLELDELGTWAYFSSSNNSIGGLDIFQLDLLNRPDIVYLNLKIIDKETNGPLPQSEFDVYVDGKDMESNLAPAESGFFKVPLASHRISDLSIIMQDGDTINQRVSMEFEDQELILSAENIQKLKKIDSLLFANSKTSSKDSIVVISSSGFDVGDDNTQTKEIVVQDLRTGATVVERFESSGKLKKLVFNNILFEYNKAEILPESRPDLNFLARFLEKNPKHKILIEGHTSSEGEYLYNMALSGRRADAIKEFLINSGIPKFRLATLGFGPDKPVADNSLEAGRILNRRVEVNIIE